MILSQKSKFPRSLRKNTGFDYYNIFLEMHFFFLEIEGTKFLNQESYN